MTPDIIYDQFIGMGCANKLVFSWAGNPGVGSLHRLRDAVENGWPHELEIEEHTHAAMANAYEAGAAGLPFAVLRGYLGGDLPNVNPKSSTSPAPSPAKKLAAVPALRPDVAVIHAQQADRAGQRPDRGHPRRSEGSGAGLEALDRDCRGDRRRAAADRSLNAVVLPHWTVGHVVEVPGGAFPPTRRATTRATTPSTSLGRDLARARRFPRLDETQRAGQGPDVFAEHVRKLRTAAE